MKKLESEEDAFGRAFLAVQKGEEVHEIVERDDGFVNTMPTKTYFSDYEAWLPIEQKAMQFVKGRVLDIGCGAGRHSLYLQRKGFDVLGIDISPLAIKICKSRGLQKSKLMPIDDIDFKPNAFDTILMMGNNFGLFGNIKKAKKLLKSFHTITSKNAMIIASSRDPYKTDNSAHLQYHKMNRQRGRMSGQVRIRIRYEQYKGRWFDYLMVSKEEMSQILSDTGWKIKEFLDTGNSLYIAIIKKTLH